MHEFCPRSPLDQEEIELAGQSQTVIVSKDTGGGSFSSIVMEPRSSLLGVSAMHPNGRGHVTGATAPAPGRAWALRANDP